jgi:hypothetical protein
VPEQTCFQQAGFLHWNVPARLYKDLLTSERYQLACHYFLKSEEIPALLYVGKGPEYRPLRDFGFVPSAYWPGAQISNHKKACTHTLLLYIGVV